MNMSTIREHDVFLITHRIISTAWVLQLLFLANSIFNLHTSNTEFLLVLLPSFTFHLILDLVQTQIRRSKREFIQELQIIIACLFITWGSSTLIMIVQNTPISFIPGYGQLSALLATILFCIFAFSSLLVWDSRNQLHVLLANTKDIQATLQFHHDFITKTYEELKPLQKSVDFYFASSLFVYSIALLMPHSTPIVGGIVLCILYIAYLQHIGTISLFRFEHTLLANDCPPLSGNRGTIKKMILGLMVISLLFGFLFAQSKSIIPQQTLVSLGTNLIQQIKKAVDPKEYLEASAIIREALKNDPNEKSNYTPIDLAKAEREFQNQLVYIKTILVLAAIALFIWLVIRPLLLKRQYIVPYIINWLSDLKALFLHIFRKRQRKKRPSKKNLSTPVSKQAVKIAMSFAGASQNANHGLNNKIIKLYIRILSLMLHYGLVIKSSDTPEDFSRNFLLLLKKNWPKHELISVFHAHMFIINSAFLKEVFSADGCNPIDQQKMEESLSIISALFKGLERNHQDS